MKIYLLAKFDGYGGSLNDAERSRNYDLRLQARFVLDLCLFVGGELILWLADREVLGVRCSVAHV